MQLAEKAIPKKTQNSDYLRFIEARASQNVARQQSPFRKRQKRVREITVCR